MAYNTNTRTITELLMATTLDNYGEKAYEQVFSRIPMFEILEGKGRVEVKPGGEYITERVIASKATGVSSFEGFEEVELPVQDPFKTLVYRFRNYEGPVVIAWDQMKANQGKYQIINLLSALKDLAVKTIRDTVNTELWAKSRPKSSSIYGIPLFIVKDPTASATVGGYDCSTETWWRNISETSAASSYAALMKEIRKVIHSCSDNSGEDTPDIIITDQDGYETVEGYVTEKGRWIMSDRLQKLNIALESIPIGKADLVWDSAVPNMYDTSSTYSSFFFINTKYLKWRVGSDRKGLEFTGLQRASRQIAYSGFYLMRGALICTSRRTQGLLHKVVKTITS